MKRVFSADTVVPCDLLRSLLEEEGIPAMLRTEAGGVAGDLPMPTGAELIWPRHELWVNDEDYEAALALVAAFQSGEG